MLDKYTLVCIIVVSLLIMYDSTLGMVVFLLDLDYYTVFICLLVVVGLIFFERVFIHNKTHTNEHRITDHEKKIS